MNRSLTSAEAAALLAADGPNALPVAERKGLLATALGVVREPMFLLLVAAAGVYLVVGDVREALVLTASIVVVIAITIVQGRKAERALDALRDLSSPRSRAIIFLVALTTSLPQTPLAAIPLRCTGIAA